MSNRSSKFTASPIGKVFPYWPSYVIRVSFVPASSRGAAEAAGYGTPDRLRYARLAPPDRNQTRLPLPRSVEDAQIPLGRLATGVRIME